MKKIVTLNVGSSSCKFQIFLEDLTFLGKGMIERIGIKGTNISYEDKDGKKYGEDKDIDINDLAIYLKDFLIKNNLIDFDEIKVMTHRVVMGGELFKENIIVNNIKTIEKIESLSPLAPLHQPYNVLLMKTFFNMYKDIKHIAVFDTTFHMDIPEENYLYPLPIKFYEDLKIRKYGAHGTNYQYVTEVMQKTLGKKNVNLIALHLGNGASVCLIKDSKSLDTSMGLTPLAGLMMGTRSGDVDPSIAFYLINKLNYSPKEVEEIFIKKSGLLGIYQKSSDMRDIIKSIETKDEKAILARKMFANRIRNYLAVYLNQIEKIDAIIFTAGIGENDKDLIRIIFKNFYLKVVKLEKVIINDYNLNLISTSDSEVPIYIVKANEELQMAKIANQLLKS